MATAGIGEQSVTLKLTAIAHEEIEDYRILCFSNVDERVIMSDAATEKPIGVSGQAKDLHSTDTYEAGFTVDIAVQGITYIKMSGSGLRGNSVVATTDGKGQKFTLASSDQYCIGSALKNWNDGDIIPVLLQLHYFGDTSDAS